MKLLSSADDTSGKTKKVLDPAELPSSLHLGVVSIQPVRARNGDDDDTGDGVMSRVDVNLRGDLNDDETSPAGDADADPPR